MEWEVQGSRNFTLEYFALDNLVGGETLSLPHLVANLGMYSVDSVICTRHRLSYRHRHGSHGC